MADSPPPSPPFQLPTPPANSTSEVVSTLLIPMQSAVVEGLVYAAKLAFGVNSRSGATIWATGMMLVTMAVTLNVAIFELDLSKAQRAGSAISLVTQAVFALAAQLKNIAADPDFEVAAQVEGVLARAKAVVGMHEIMQKNAEKGTGPTAADTTADSGAAPAGAGGSSTPPDAHVSLNVVPAGTAPDLAMGSAATSAADSAVNLSAGTSSGAAAPLLSTANANA